MIGRLSGTLVDKSPPTVVLDVHGVGYEVDVPMSTFYNLPALGAAVTLLTHFVVREDAQLLYGFLTAPERSTFRELVKIMVDADIELLKAHREGRIKVPN